MCMFDASHKGSQFASLQLFRWSLVMQCLLFNLG